jgi:hypothetical protein
MKTKRNKSMKSILKLILLTTCIVLVVSCSTESISDLSEGDLTSVELKSGKKVERPISIVLEGIDDLDGIGGTFTGRMTHLGKIHGTVGAGTFLPNGDGTFTFTSTEDDVVIAANGDQLFSRSSLIFVPVSATSFTYTGTISFVGGTGRFAGVPEENGGSMQIDNGVYTIIGPNEIPGGFQGTTSHNGAGTIIY